MPRKPKRVLLGLEVTKAIRTRKCSAEKAHKVSPGELLLEVKAPGPASGVQPYCASCASRMLAIGHDELNRIQSELQIDD